MNEYMIIDFLNSFDQAMVKLDVNALNDMMEEDAILQHITGYLQPKHEWLSEVKVDAFTYREVYSDNFEFEFSGSSECIVEYDWTIIGNSRWPFRNRITLIYDGVSIKWAGRNQLWFR